MPLDFDHDERRKVAPLRGARKADPHTIFSTRSPSAQPSGQALKEEGLYTVTRGHEEWLRDARTAAALIAAREGVVTTDELQDILALPEGAHPSLWGSVLRSPAFVHVGYCQSRRPSAHARVIGIWRNPC